MSGFNTSPRRDNVSVRLKAQNIKNAQAETKKLELESRKMEERLRELKVAMGKEKEQREKQGGFWKRGQTGTLGSYATEVLQKPTQKETKKRGVKLLKDEKIVLPQRISEPGTMKYIADSYNRNKQLKCGQCEDRSASVSCVQCSEYFCAGCFSAFHYKGALKRHRTVPLQASGPRQCMSPRVSGPPSNRSAHGAEASAVNSVQYQNTDRNSPVGASGSVGQSSLLSGQFDEDESAASFQDALKAWRNGDAEGTSPSNKRVASTSNPERPVSRVTTPIVKTESSTSTQEKKQPIEIKFTNHGVSYADRLLLKKHRRTDVDQIITPGTTSSNSTEQMVNGEEEDLEPVDFQALYEAMVPSSTTPNSLHTISSLSIIELDTTPKKRYKDVEQSSQYQVEEVSEMTAWAIQNSINLPTSTTAASHHSSITSSPPSNHGNTISPTSNHGNTKSSARQTTESQIQNSDLKKDNSTVKSNNEQKSTKDHPEKSTRPPSSRSKSSAGYRTHSARSRPASRAKSRAMSRMQIEGVLTKTPTPALHDIAQLAEKETPMEAVSQYRSVFDDFFTGTDTSNKRKSPTPMPSNKKKDIKVSYALYQMAPRSWKAENSFSDMISSEEAVLPELSDTIKACLPGEMAIDSQFDMNISNIESRKHSEINPSSTDVGSKTTSEMNPFSRFMEGQIKSRNNSDMSQLQGEISDLKAERLHMDSEMKHPRRDIGTRINSNMNNGTRREMGSRTNSEISPSRKEMVSRTHSDMSIGRRNSSNSPGKEVYSKSLKNMDGRHSSKEHESFLPKWDRQSHRDEEYHEEMQCRRNKSNPRRQKIEEEFERELLSRNSNRLNTDMITPIRLEEISCKTETPVPQKADCIVINGDDYSQYDDQTNNQSVDDEETLDKLEWELASESGRITADGKISRLSRQSNSRSNSSCSTVRNSLNSSITDQGYDINTRLREDELGESDDDDEMLTDRDDVRALH